MAIKDHYVTLKQDPYVPGAFVVNIDGREYQTKNQLWVQRIDRLVIWNVDIYRGVIELSSSFRLREPARRNIEECYRSRYILPMVDCVPDYDHVKHDPNSPWLQTDEEGQP